MLGREETELLGLERRPGRHRSQRHTAAKRAIDDANERDHATVLIVGGVEDQRPCGRVGLAGWRRNALNRGVEYLGDALTGLRRDPQHRRRIVADEVRHLGGYVVGSRLCEIDLVQDRNDLEIVLDRQIGVGKRLRLDALSGIDDQQCALARRERARDLVAEVHVAGRIDQIELMALPLDPDGPSLDRDAPLPLEIHRIEQLVAHLALADRLRDLQDPVGQSRLTVVDVGDDREVANLAQGDTVCIGHGEGVREPGGRA